MPQQEPESGGRAPCTIRVEAGVHFWCACGRTSFPPFCDGSHSGTGIQPVRWELKEAKVISWCGCQRTSTPPFCDGSHREEG
ncbi:CDGSH iron-sulfur domain-containing protein [Haloferula luteola]|uniref:CDGSH iron-sulfur domain-containing protein n=1 Tax=Haloferula luteola TaxID=595692 RepID=UPI00161BBD10|nr:CDGSH iron-sulfur domain-containing protein [Haloferula luteola]